MNARHGDCREKELHAMCTQGRRIMPNSNDNLEIDSEKSVVDDRAVPAKDKKDPEDTAGGLEGQFSDKDRDSKDEWSPGSNQPSDQ